MEYFDKVIELGLMTPETVLPSILLYTVPSDFSINEIYLIIALASKPS